MNLDALRVQSGYFFLGSPYSKYPGGLFRAFLDICDIRARLIAAEVPCFSPIIHSHYVAFMGHIDPKDYSIWMESEKPMRDAARGLIVVMMKGWRESHGLSLEIAEFKASGRPVLYLEPDGMTLTAEPL